MFFIFKRKMPMKKIHFQSLFMIFFMGAVMITTAARGNNLPDSIPKGWKAPVNKPPDLIIGIDTTVKHSGKASGIIQRPLALKPSTGHVIMMQSIVADGFRNKRVRLTVFARSKEVESGAYFFFQANGTDTILTYANTGSNMIYETNEWTRYQITLDVPEAAVKMEFGVKMAPGQGTIWVDDFNLEVVDQNIPSDDWVVPRKLRMAVTKWKYQPNTKAMNLGFEDR